MLNRPERFAESLPAQFDGVFLWDFLQGAFGPSIMPMDLDGVVERNGRFLIFETKAPGVLVPEGQRRTFQQLRLARKFTIVFTAKNPADVKGWEVWTARQTRRWLGDAAQFKQWCAAWYAYANGDIPPAWFHVEDYYDD